MSKLLGPNGEPINPAAYYQLVPDDVLDSIYDAFDTDAPMAWDIEWTGERHNLIVYGWGDIATTDKGHSFQEYGKVVFPMQVPEGYVYVDNIP